MVDRGDIDTSSDVPFRRGKLEYRSRGYPEEDTEILLPSLSGYSKLGMSFWLASPSESGVVESGMPIGRSAYSYHQLIRGDCKRETRISTYLNFMRHTILRNITFESIESRTSSGLWSLDLISGR